MYLNIIDIVKINTFQEDAGITAFGIDPIVTTACWVKHCGKNGGKGCFFCLKSKLKLRKRIYDPI